MDSPSLVSVIIIFLDAEKFIQEAIDSVFEQSYAHWELLLIDDGSTDASSDIAHSVASDNPERVRYLEHPHHQNKGMSASRNLGIHHARGEYIAFLDSDDVWFPFKLKKQTAILSAQPDAAMVYGRSQYWNSWRTDGENRLEDFEQDHGIVPDVLYPPPSLLPLFLTGKAAVPCPSSILVRRKNINSVGGFVDSFIGPYMVYEDQAFYAKLCLEYSVIPANECWDRYRQHPDQSCVVATRQGQEYLSRWLYLKWLAKYLSLQGYDYPELWEPLNREIWLYRHYDSQHAVPSFLSKSWLRWVKKWVLRLENALLPEPIRIRNWTRNLNPD